MGRAPEKNVAVRAALAGRILSAPQATLRAHAHALGINEGVISVYLREEKAEDFLRTYGGALASNENVAAALSGVFKQRANREHRREVRQQLRSGPSHAVLDYDQALRVDAAKAYPHALGKYECHWLLSREPVRHCRETFKSGRYCKMHDRIARVQEERRFETEEARSQDAQKVR